MVFYTQGDLENQICLYDEKLDLGLTGKTIGECIDIIFDACPRLHNREYLKELTRDNLESIEAVYGFKALRLFYYDTIKQDLLQSYTGKDRLQLKYEKLLDNIKEHHTECISNLKYTL